MHAALAAPSLPRVRALLAPAIGALAILLAAAPAGYAHSRPLRCAHLARPSARRHSCLVRRKPSLGRPRRASGRGVSSSFSVPLPSLRRTAARRPSGSSSVAVPFPGAPEAQAPASGTHAPGSGAHVPAGPRCGDGSAPVALGAETFACDDGGEPACEAGTQLGASADGLHLVCQPETSGSAPAEEGCEAAGCAGVEGGECGEAQVVGWRAQTIACEPASEVEA